VPLSESVESCFRSFLLTIKRMFNLVGSIFSLASLDASPSLADVFCVSSCCFLSFSFSIRSRHSSHLPSIISSLAKTSQQSSFSVPREERRFELPLQNVCTPAGEWIFAIVRPSPHNYNSRLLTVSITQSRVLTLVPTQGEVMNHEDAHPGLIPNIQKGLACVGVSMQRFQISLSSVC
jgi:hypothetical protein